MDLRENINKIHSDLILLEGIGETVTIKESTSKEFGNHFVITAEHKGMTAKMIVEKTEIEKGVFNWGYYSNPNETTGIVERRSSLNEFVNDVIDIFEKKRFDSDYLSQITD
jgi:hypothetical protein